MGTIPYPSFASVRVHFHYCLTVVCPKKRYAIHDSRRKLSRRDRQAYCLYRRRRTRQRHHKQLVGATPEPPYYYSSHRAAEREVNETKNKTKMVAMRFSESDHRAIKRKAEQANMNFTEFITASALNKRITVIEGLDGVLKEQKAIGRNLNQLTTLCNMGIIQNPELQAIKEQHGRVMELLGELSGRCE